MIGSPEFRAEMRWRSVRPESRQLLVARLAGSSQEPDISEPVNCGGLGRIRHFGRATEPPWPDNHLPSGPARYRLGLGDKDGVLRAQVFQNSACDWRCWYCYVPFGLLGAHQRDSEWRTADQLVTAWQQEPAPAQVLDLSGGQPDLVPEWVPWTMRALIDRGLETTTYLWSDDNLSSDYFWRYLNDDDIALVGSYRNYGRAVCFKGIDAASFAFNTAAPEEGYGRQFQHARRLLEAGIDLYCYVTLTTTAEPSVIRSLIPRFVDRLQEVDPNLPLRTVPLQVGVFSPVRSRIRADHTLALERQTDAVLAWNDEISTRFADPERVAAPHEVPLGARR